jgi:hypothetical protein
MLVAPYRRGTRIHHSFGRDWPQRTFPHATAGQQIGTVEDRRGRCGAEGVPFGTRGFPMFPQGNRTNPFVGVLEGSSGAMNSQNGQEVWRLPHRRSLHSARRTSQGALRKAHFARLRSAYEPSSRALADCSNGACSERKAHQRKAHQRKRQADAGMADARSAF